MRYPLYFDTFRLHHNNTHSQLQALGNQGKNILVCS